ncbi:MAG: hypothetical protein DMG24_17595 [Acidobacteria bacterium]|nr:MAG: hypothetical protein DMG24_17595 [Acidobacteriota bacterium]
MASAAASLPRRRANAVRPRARRPRNQPAAGRAPILHTYYVKRINNCRLRREIDWPKLRECYSLLGLVTLAFVFGLLYACQHFNCVRYGYRIEELKSQRAVLEEWNRELRLKQASLTDPQRIDTLARRRLGLVPPDPQQVILLDPAPTESDGRPEFANNFPIFEPLAGSALGHRLRGKTQRR